jgi:hypothetical protein
MDSACVLHEPPSRLRYILGMAQMFGAVFSLTLVLENGLNTMSLASVIRTGVLTEVSRILFRTT